MKFYTIILALLATPVFAFEAHAQQSEYAQRSAECHAKGKGYYYNSQRGCFNVDDEINKLQVCTFDRNLPVQIWQTTEGVQKECTQVFRIKNYNPNVPGVEMRGFVEKRIK